LRPDNEPNYVYGPFFDAAVRTLYEHVANGCK